MILAQSLAEARAQRTQRVLPDGRAIWVSRVFPTSGATPEMPMASLVEQLAHTVIPTHFHAVNQFQVLVEGQGALPRLGRHQQGRESLEAHQRRRAASTRHTAADASAAENSGGTSVEITIAPRAAKTSR